MLRQMKGHEGHELDEHPHVKTAPDLRNNLVFLHWAELQVRHAIVQLKVGQHWTGTTHRREGRTLLVSGQV